MPIDTEKKICEAYDRLKRLRIDISRHDDHTVCLNGDGLMTIEDLESLIFLMKEKPNWQLPFDGDE